MARNARAFYIEPNGDEGFKFTRGSAKRASGTADTQKGAIDAARRMEPDGAIHAARVTPGSDPEKFLKIKGE